MKKLILGIALLAMATMTTFLACKKDDKAIKSNYSKSSNSKALLKTAQEEEEYFDNIIKTVSYGLVDLVTNQNFRLVVSSQVNLKFDSDDNVLLKTLDSVLNTQGINLKQEMINALNNQGKQSLTQYVDAAVNGFEYFGGTKYTQIYVPFIDNKNIIATTPKICLNFNGDEILNSIIREGANIVEANVDELYAMENNVYVVSVNECVNDLGRVNEYIPFDPNGNTPLDPSNFPTTLQNSRSLFVKEINISDRKEGWGNGRSDISFIAITTKPSCVRQPDAVGLPFCKLAKRDLNKWFTPTFGNLTIADGITTFWEAFVPEDVAIIFFEQDVRSKFGRTFHPWYCSTVKAFYNSKESPYGIIYPIHASYGGYGNTKIYPLIGGDFKMYGKRLY